MSILVTFIFLLLPVGEQLHYTIRFGPFRVGTLDLTIKNIEVISEESCYHFTAHLKSNPGWRFLFSIDDWLESYTRINDFATLRSYKRSAESKYQNETRADFDYQSMKIIYSDSSVFELKPEAKDLLSVWYYFRTLPLKHRDTLLTQIHLNKKNYDVKIKISGPQTVKTGIGKFECIIIKTETSGNQDIGTVYISDDERKVPAMIKKKFSIGHIVAILKEIGG